MPVKYYGDEYGRYDDENYSYRIRPGSSGDFARRRRYGGYDEDDDNYVMSQVSLPLRLSQLDNNQRRDTSPFESYYSSRRSNRTQREVSPYSSRSRLSGPAKQALAFCGELDEDDPYYRARKCIPSPSEYEFEDDADEEQQMSWSDSRRFKQPPRYHPREDQREISTRHRSSTAPLSKHAGVKERHRSRKRDHEEDDFNPAYVMPVSRRRAEDISTDEEPAIREVTSYMAKRKQFAVEDDDELQKFKNQKYQYRTRGPFQRYSDLFDETDPREKYSRAPMFDMKLRSHVIWEKMYVKFTCTIRGNPDPKVTWYHNMVAIEPTMLIPGVMRISSQFGVHTLEIFQACLNDSGTYRVSAQNHKGEISSYATLLVRRYDGSKTGYYDIKSGYNLKKPTDYPDVEKCNVPEQQENNITSPGDDDSKSSEEKSLILTHTGSSSKVGDGKFESVLQFHIPGKKRLSLDSQTFTIQESPIEPTKTTNKTKTEEESTKNERENDKVSEVELKHRKREELSDCLHEDVCIPESNRSQSPLNQKEVVAESIIETKKSRPQQSKDDTVPSDEYAIENVASDTFTGNSDV